MTEIITNYDLILSNPTYYAEIFSEGNQELEELLLYCYQNNIRTVACCNGEGHDLCYIYFASNINNIQNFKYIINGIVNDFDGQYAVRSKINFPGFEDYTGIILRADANKSSEFFSYILRALKSKRFLVSHLVVDEYLKIVRYLKSNKVDASDVSVVYENHEYSLKMFKNVKNIQGYLVDVDYDHKNINEFSDATLFEDLKGKIDFTGEEVKTFRENVLMKIKK